MRLGAGGRVELAERQPGDAELPVDLHAALREWAAIASALGADAQPDQQDIIRRRGRQLAGRLADVLGRPVEYHDPLTGGVALVHGRSAAVRVPSVPAPRQPAFLRAPRPDPTPWHTGLPIAAFCALFAALADITLSRAFGEAFGVLWVPANLMVALGLAPSLWLLRRVRFWRWSALGVAVGLGIAWLVLLLDVAL